MMHLLVFRVVANYQKVFALTIRVFVTFFAFTRNQNGWKQALPP